MSESLAILETVADEVRADLAETAAKVINQGPRGGPKTAEGLEIASRNSLQHGLTGSGIHLPAELRDEVVRWTDVLKRRYRPMTEEAKEQIDAAALAFAQYRGALAEQTRYLVRRSLDALLHWDDRRTAEAELLARKLSALPGLTAASLRTTYRGTEWLLKRWKTLRAALEQKGDWTEEETALAHDLLGVDRLERPYDPARIARATADERKAIVDQHCEALEDRLAGDFAAFEQSARLDEIDGKGYLLDKTYLKLERYARDAQRRYDKQIALLDAYRKTQPRELRKPIPEPLPEIKLPEGFSWADTPVPTDVHGLIKLLIHPRRKPQPPDAPAPVPTPAPAAPGDQGRELRADPAEPTAIPRPRMPLTAQQRQLVERAFPKPAGKDRRNRR